MGQLGEVSLIQHLPDTESLGVLAREGVRAEIIPNEDLRKVYDFSINYFHQSGRTKAPSVAVLRSEFGDVLDALEIDIEHEPDESIEWAIDDLKGSYAHQHGQEFLRNMAVQLAEADTATKVDTLSAGADQLMQISYRLEDRSARVDVRESGIDRMLAYQERVMNRGLVEGISLGLPEVDAYTRRIHPGELGVVAGGPKSGKSYAVMRAGYATWCTGLSTALYTLENSVEMTMDRMLAAATGVSSRAWQHGEMPPEHVEAMRLKADEFANADVPFWVLQPDLGQRTVPYIVRDALLRGAQALIIDQLTYLELPDPRKQKTERIGDALHLLHGMISTGRDRIPVLLAHQINREGVAAARKEGRLRMEHMAESSEVERTADWVFGLFQSETQKMVDQITLQILAVRRDSPHAWNLDWDMDTGYAHVRGDADIDG